MKRFQPLNFVLVLALSILIVACKKDHRLLGNDAVPDEDKLEASTLEGFPIIGFSQKYDSIVSLNSDIKYLGVNNDGIVGKLDIGLYTKFNISVSDLNFGSAAQLVSSEIVLAINNTNHFGNSTAQLTYSVYVMDSVMNYKRAYYTNNTKLHSNNLITVATSGSTTVSGKTAIRIPIDSTFAATLMKNNAALVNNDYLQNAYRGFYIKTSTAGEGVIYQCDLSDDISGFYLKYRKTPSDTVSQFRFTFNGSFAARFNTVKFTPVSDLAAQFAGDTAAGAQRIYLKGMGGAKAKVYVPWLKNYGDTFKVAVNRAQLFFYLDDTYLASLKSTATQNYFYAPKLCLYALDSLGRETTLRDLKNINYVSRFDGAYDSENKRYAFNIPLHAEAILSGKIKNYGFVIAMTDPDPIYSAFRDLNQQSCILQGAAAVKKPTFKLDYIRLKGE